MSGTELQVLEIIWDWGGEASIDTIAREAKISTEYAHLICESLARQDCIDLLLSKIAKLRGKGRLEVAKRKVNASPKKIVVLENDISQTYGNKKKKIILGY